MYFISVLIAIQTYFAPQYTNAMTWYPSKDYQGAMKNFMKMWLSDEDDDASGEDAEEIDEGPRM